MRVRNTLQYVFEKHFEFDFEAIRRKTFEAAERQLAKIKGLSPFVRNYSLQAALGSHVVPLDQSMCNAVIWLGLVEPESTPDSAADDLKSSLRKSDAQLFCHLLRQLATDPKLRPTFESAAANAPEEGYDALAAPERLTELFKNPRGPKKRTTTRKKAVPAKKKKSTTSRKKKSDTKARKKTVKKKTKTKKKTKKKSRSSSR
jgi:endonuclease-3